MQCKFWECHCSILFPLLTCVTCHQYTNWHVLRGVTRHGIISTLARVTCYAAWLDTALSAQQHVSRVTWLQHGLPAHCSTQRINIWCLGTSVSGNYPRWGQQVNILSIYRLSTQNKLISFHPLTRYSLNDFAMFVSRPIESILWYYGGNQKSEYYYAGSIINSQCHPHPHLMARKYLDLYNV